MKRIIIPLLVFCIFFSLTFLSQASFASDISLAPVIPTPFPPENQDSNQIEELRKAIEQAINSQKEYVLGYLVNKVEIQNTRITEDMHWGIAWLALKDLATGEPLPNEPGLVLAQHQTSGWQVVLPSDSDWIALLEAIPTELLTNEVKNHWTQIYEEQLDALDEGPFGGYLLPWEAGRTAWLSQSVGHDKYIPSGSAHFAFDFYIPQTMYNLYAAKSGTVWFARWNVPNNNHDGVGNYLVLKDNATSPVTYQLYLHLAQDSIPPALRIRDTQVVQGQFIGVADNTGQSTGHHLHFQVHTNPDSYWGSSVDITFNDVTINGGRPRRNDNVYSDFPYCKSTDVCDEFSSFYVSQNVIHGDVVAPTGGITQPATGSTINSNTLHLEGWAFDQGSGIAEARFIANYAGAWHDIGEVFTTQDFLLDWDTCSDNVPEGPVSLALKIRDNEGNYAFGLPGLTHISNLATCAPPPPECIPGDNQVSIFSDSNYSGACVLLEVSDYPNSEALSGLGDDNAESIRIGNDVLATLYSDASYNGRGETFTQNDSNLADNWVGANHLTSIIIRNRSAIGQIQPPPQLIAPQNGASFPFRTSLSLSWRVPFGATEFQVAINGPSPVTSSTSTWQSEPIWHLEGNLVEAGDYQWKVRARYQDKVSEWSTFSSFSIDSSSSPSVPILNAPFFDDMESGMNGWSSSGLWQQVNNLERAHSVSHSWYYGEEGDYRDGTTNTGDLTSPPIQLPDAEGSYSLNFWYRYNTESSGNHWDQRWVQISKDGEPFENVLQLYDDPPNYWLNPALDLSNYAGSTIKVRFHFETLDGAFNYFEGWYIDDFTISSNPLPSCNDSDNTPNQATPIEFGETKTGSICPSGDIDYYQFTADSGDRILVDIDTPSQNAPDDLDLVLTLLDTDGISVLSEHDDEIPALRKDPHLGFLISRSGTYYLKTKLWSHPSGGGVDYTYSIHLFKDFIAPTANFSNPSSGNYYSGQTLSLNLTAEDPQSGVSHVQFLWHSADWLHDSWVYAGEDWDGQDGWNLNFDTSDLDDQYGLAFYANIYDWAGNWVGAGTWDIGLDRVPPISTIKSISSTQGSTAILLEWTGEDQQSGIDHYDLQYQTEANAWIDIQPDPTGSQDHTWFIGDPGVSYKFRLRGVDRAMNSEEFSSANEINTSIPLIAELCSQPDIWEDDNQPAKANPIDTSGLAQIHNLCKSGEPDFLNDHDWMMFFEEEGNTYLVESTPIGGGAATKLELFSEDGTTLLASSYPVDYESITSLLRTADRSGMVFILVTPIDSRIAGNTASYKIQVRNPLLFLPLVDHND